MLAWHVSEKAGKAGKASFYNKKLVLPYMPFEKAGKAGKVCFYSKKLVLPYMPLEKAGKVCSYNVRGCYSYTQTMYVGFLGF